MLLTKKHPSPSASGILRPAGEVVISAQPAPFDVAAFYLNKGKIIVDKGFFGHFGLGHRPLVATTPERSYGVSTLRGGATVKAVWEQLPATFSRLEDIAALVALQSKGGMGHLLMGHNRTNVFFVVGANENETFVVDIVWCAEVSRWIGFSCRLDWVSSYRFSGDRIFYPVKIAL